MNNQANLARLTSIMKVADAVESVKDNKELSISYLVNYIKNTVILPTYLFSRRASRKTKTGRKTFERQQFKWFEPTFRHHLCCWPVRSHLAANMAAKMYGTTCGWTKTSKLPTQVRLLFGFLFCANTESRNPTSELSS